uniref:Secreted protein n=1 Tax=Anopheles farauti TaxID=69004 RepID=A0A182Q7M6_9DIPT
MLTKYVTRIYVLLLAASTLALGGHAFSCRFCQSVNNFNSCVDSAGQVECSDGVVNMTHLQLLPHNPSLARAAPTPGQYQCFQANFTSNGVWNYQMGCTFAGSKLCDGWKVLSQCRLTGEGKNMAGQVAAKPALLSTLKPQTSAAVPSTSTSAGVVGTGGVPSVSTTTAGAKLGWDTSSTPYSTLPPKNDSTIGDRSRPEARSIATAFTTQLGKLLLFWIVVSFWRHF